MDANFAVEVAVQNEDEKDVKEIEKPLADQVIDLYETCLQSGLIISTSFKGVIENKLDNKRKWMQTLFLSFLVGYIIPRYSVLCVLYAMDKETKKTWEFYLPNYFDQIGLFGKVLNSVFAVFGSMIVVDMLYFRRYESIGRMDYLTNMDTLRDNINQPGIEVAHDSQETVVESIGDEEKQSLLKGMKTKLLLLKNSIIVMYLSVCSYHVISCPLFFYNERPHMITGILAVTNMLMMFVLHFSGTSFLLNIYTSYVLTVDYFSSRIRFMMTGLNDNLPSEVKMTRVLKQYNLLMMDFQKQDYLLKYLLRNMMYGYCSGLTILFLLFTVDMNPFLRLFVLTGVTVLSLTMLTSGLYVGHLHTMTLVMYSELNSMAARNTPSIKSYKALKTRRNLLNCIKELGSQQTDGQFVLGLRDGHGSATSRMEMFQLTMATISNTLMMLDVINHSNAI
jgi:hypothetical protein